MLISDCSRPQWSWRWSWTGCTAESATPGSTPTRSSDIRKVLGEWPSPTNRATLQPSRLGLSSSSMGRLTRGWVLVRLMVRLADLTSLSPRWRWSPTYWTTSCVTSVREVAVGESSLPSSVRTSLVCRWENREDSVFTERCLFTLCCLVLLRAVLVLHSQQAGAGVPQTSCKGGRRQTQGCALPLVLGDHQHQHQHQHQHLTNNHL